MKGCFSGSMLGGRSVTLKIERWPSLQFVSGNLTSHEVARDMSILTNEDTLEDRITPRHFCVFATCPSSEDSKSTTFSMFPAIRAEINDDSFQDGGHEKLKPTTVVRMVTLRSRKPVTARTSRPGSGPRPSPPDSPRKTISCMASLY